MIDFFKRMFSQTDKEKDPICGMEVDIKKTLYHSVFDHKHYYFCSVEHKKQFDENPTEYIHEFC